MQLPALLQQLREHLRRNLVRFGKTWHCQTQGIPQVPADLYCNLWDDLLC